MATDVIKQISQYKYIYFGFDPAGENSSNLWKATPVMCGSNDATNWTVIAHFPQLGNLRDGNIAVYKDWYYITGTTGLYRTKDFNDFEELDSSFIEQRAGFHDIWAPEFFVDLQGNWHMIWSANNGQRHNYVCDFNPETGEATNTWQLIDEDGGIDGHIWTYNNKYYLSIDGYWLYQSDSYMGPFELIKNNIDHSGENKSHWYEAGETLQVGDTIYFYMDKITGEVPGVADSGYMVVQTAKVNDLAHWSGQQRVISSINMRHGSFLNVQTAHTNNSTQPGKLTTDYVKITHLNEPVDVASNTKHNYEQCMAAINTIYSRFGDFLGEDFKPGLELLTLKDGGLGRSTWLYVVRAFDQLKEEINRTVGVFRSNGFANLRTKKDFEYLEIIRPVRLILDTEYQTIINKNWDAIQSILNDFLKVLNKFHA